MSADLPLQPNYHPRPEECSGEPLIELKEIVKTFSNAAGEFIALNGVTACFYPGEFVSVVGKSGSGKSTLVNMITGIDHPTSGSVRVEGKEIHTLTENDMSIWRGRNLGIVFQFFQLLPTLTLLENVILPMYLAGLYTPVEREKRAAELLALVGLNGFEDKLPGAVSGGQQQSAAIARALANDPPILIADEPTGNLDSRTADEVFVIFEDLIAAGKTILMVTHDIGLAGRTTRTLLLSDGELINPWVAEAMARLNHQHMLWLSKHLEPKNFPADATVRTSANHSEWVYIVTAGSLEVRPNGSGAAPRRIPPGACLTSFDLQAAGLNGRSELRAGPSEALELMTVEGPRLEEWLSPSGRARAAMERFAAQRNGASHPTPESEYQGEAE
jgi:putative ABC transport system ATP-binding protein